jgi:hypothetical protein
MLYLKEYGSVLLPLKKEESVDLFGAVKTAVAKHSAAKDVESQANGIYEDILAEIKATEKVPRGQEHFLALKAASLAEVHLLGNIDLLLEQLDADKKRAMPNEVGVKIINRIRDIKIHALEADGNVNPLDQATIQLQANGLKAAARSAFTSIRMRDRGIDPLQALNTVEIQLIQKAAEKYSCDYHKWQREAQAVLWAVAELRIQQFLAVVSH